ncbi:MAG: cytochrome c oxidase assembly protein [Gaiellaceae bacterium]
MRGALLVVVLAALATAPAASAHGDDVPRDELWSSWDPAWPVLVAAALALSLFVQAYVRLRRRGRGDHAGPGRALLFCLGLAVAVGALVSPLDAVGQEYLLSGHMLQHLLIGDVAPALLLVAVRGPLVFFLLPQRILAPLARFGPLRAILRTALRPGVALGCWLTVFAVWHVPAVYGAALEHRPLHELQHACFAIAGVLVWTQLVDPARRRSLTRARRVGLALCLFAAGQALADVLVFSFDDLYPAYAAQDERLLGLSPHTDQQLAGVVMMGVQLVTLGTCAALLLASRARLRVRLRGERLASGLRS